MNEKKDISHKREKKISKKRADIELNETFDWDWIFDKGWSRTKK